MTRLGFVGVGRHAQKMAAAFRECGAEVVAYWRKRLPEYDGPSAWGALVPWRDQIASPDIDALIICAPPDVTTEVALACAKAGKRCVATKPLTWTEPPALKHRWAGPTGGNLCSVCGMFTERDALEKPMLPCIVPSSRVFVDLWRLYSPAWKALKAELRGKTIQSVSVDFYGNGPVREFSAALDWGPHALAFAIDLLGSMPRINWDDHGNVFGVNGLWTGDNGHHAGAVRLAFGNRVPVGDEYYSQAGKRRVVVRAEGRYYILLEDGEDHVLSIGGEPVMQHVKTLAIRNFCRSFLAGEPSDTLRLSCEAMRVLMPMVAEWRN